jgi:hypothetical protein
VSVLCRNPIDGWKKLFPKAVERNSQAQRLTKLLGSVDRAVGTTQYTYATMMQTASHCSRCAGMLATSSNRSAVAMHERRRDSLQIVATDMENLEPMILAC